MAINLSYSFETGIQPAATEGWLQLDNPLFSILAAIRAEGSIGRAAGRLRLSYRHLWGYLKKQESFFGWKLVVSSQGEAARLSEFGERLLWAEKRIQARLSPGAEMLAARLDNELLQAIHPDSQLVTVCASHDLLFGALRNHVHARTDALLDIEYMHNYKAVERLNVDKCMLAGMHIPLDAPHLCQRGSGIHTRIGRFLRLGDHKLIRFATRQQGLIVARGNPRGLWSIPDLQRDGVRFVNRQAGSGTRLLIDELLNYHRIDGNAIQGYGSEEPTHLSVAATVAAGLADCGFGLRAAAARFDLDFVPVVKEQYFLVCRKPVLDSPCVQAILDVLGSDDFRQSAESVPGYSAADAGQIISLRRNMPWYK